MNMNIEVSETSVIVWERDEYACWAWVMSVKRSSANGLYTDKSRLNETERHG